MVAADVERALDREPVAGPALRVAEVAETRPPHDLAAVLDHQHREAGLLLCRQPGAAIVERVRAVPPLDGGGGDERVGELGDGGHIPGLRIPDPRHPPSCLGASRPSTRCWAAAASVSPPGEGGSTASAATASVA